MTRCDTPMIRCKGCGLSPEKIGEYIWAAREEGMTPIDFVVREEGTYNQETGLFWCTRCYVKAGQPLGRA